MKYTILISRFNVIKIDTLMLRNFLGDSTTLGLYKIIYRITGEKISSFTKYGIKFDEYRKQNAKTQSDKSRLMYGPLYKIKLPTNKDIDNASVYLGGDISELFLGYDYINIKIVSESSKTIRIKLKIIFSWTGHEVIRDQVADLEKIFKYGICKLNKELKRNIKHVFDDNLVNDRFIVNIDKSNITISSHEDYEIHLVVEHYLTIIDISDVIPGGEEYIKAKTRFEQEQ